jgi:hypothetical protein
MTTQFNSGYRLEFCSKCKRHFNKRVSKKCPYCKKEAKGGKENISDRGTGSK